MSAPGPTTPLRRPTAKRAAERSSKARRPPRWSAWRASPFSEAPCLPSGSVHVAVTGTAMHWVAESAGLASTGSVFPGYRDHTDEAERRAWREAAQRQWERLLEFAT